MISLPVAIGLTTVVLLVFAAIGLSTRGGDRDLDTYVTARNSQRAGILGWSFFASGLGAWILFVPPEVGAFVGIDGLVGYAIGAAGPVAVAAAVGPVVRRQVPDGMSLSSLVHARFGPTFHAYVVGIFVLYMGVFVAAELTSVGAIGAITAGGSPLFWIVATAFVTLLYTTEGGLQASLRTDRLQGWLIVGLLFAGLWAVLDRVELAAGALDATGLLGVDRVGVEAAITLVIAVTAANVFHQGYWQRVWAADSDRTLRRASLLGAVLIVPVILVAGLSGVVAVAAGADLGTPPAPFWALLGGLPAWVAAAALILGVALVASSVDTLENAFASLAVSEIPSIDLEGARKATALLLLPAAVIAAAGLSVLRLFLIADLLAAATVVPVLTVLWSRARAGAALAGAVAGLLGAAAGSILATPTLADAWQMLSMGIGVPTLPPFLGALLASAVVSVLGSMVAPDRARHARRTLAARERTEELVGADR